MSDVDDRPPVLALMAAIKAARPGLEELLTRVDDHWGYEDGVYRYYHGSFKVYRLQDFTLEMTECLRSLAPDLSLNPMFTSIVTDGTGKVFTQDVNRAWEATTRPIVEAFFHARYFLEMAVRYGRELEHPPRLMPSGWAAVLELYGLR
jgi:hypothetical protein